jgi:hypothetical protein
MMPISSLTAFIFVYLLLFLLSLFISQENKEEIESLGGIEAITSAMKRHSGHARVQKEGCAALDNLDRF